MRRIFTFFTMMLATLTASAQSAESVTVPEGWTASQGEGNTINLQYSGNKRVKSVKVKIYHCFSVSETKKVVFSPGNLQYKASADTWRFAEHQWDYVGGTDANNVAYGNVYENGVKSDNTKIAADYDGWIDLFGWGTGDKPTHTSVTGSDYENFNDWGDNMNEDVYTWRTLAKAEWDYIINTRTTVSGIRYAKVKVKGVCGLLLLPDSWTSDIYTFSSNNQKDASFEEISDEDWEKIEVNGAVFLPSVGERRSNKKYANDNGSHNYNYGGYWSSSVASSSQGHCVGFHNKNVYTAGSPYKYYGRAVRLVRDAK
ncbi:MAG: hypothetical protein J6Y82_08105 [Bacteroidales bacterium]|nr:hypothetical protein [Bacteroidales bacterium]